MLHRTGFPVLYARKNPVNFIIVFHQVSSNDRHQFEATLRFLLNNFHITDLDGLVAATQNRMAVRGGGLVALTFDDGLRNHAEVVYPILKRLGVPATFYVCPELIDRPGSIWTWEILCYLQRLDESVRRQFFDMAGSFGDPQDIVNWMKTIPLDRREQIAREIRDCSPDFRFTALEEDRFGLMTWQQMKTLDPNLVTIGSHTATHIDLPQADSETLQHELFHSKDILELRLNREVRHFCYPNGNFNEQVVPAVQKYYSSAVTTVPGVVKVGDDPFLLKRIHVDYDLSRFSWDLAANAFRENRS
jgi:peptidoglycan/xylan/chitin deacetylase (PgdA/CDA1 family)